MKLKQKGVCVGVYMYNMYIYMHICTAVYVYVSSYLYGDVQAWYRMYISKPFWVN